MGHQTSSLFPLVELIAWRLERNYDATGFCEVRRHLVRGGGANGGYRAGPSGYDVLMHVPTENSLHVMGRGYYGREILGAIATDSVKSGSGFKWLVVHHHYCRSIPVLGQSVGEPLDLLRAEAAGGLAFDHGVQGEETDWPIL